MRRRSFISALAGVIAAKPDALKRYQRRTFWLNGLDPNVAACRSISMVNKIRISKDIAYKNQEENQLNWFDLAIKGVFRDQNY